MCFTNLSKLTEESLESTGKTYQLLRQATVEDLSPQSDDQVKQIVPDKLKASKVRQGKSYGNQIWSQLDCSAAAILSAASEVRDD